MGQPVQWQDAPSAQDVLRVYYGPAGGPGGHGTLSAELTLSEFVAAYYRPVHLISRDARPRHLEAVAQSVKYWCRFTGDPPLGAVSVYHCRDFVVALKALPGRKYGTLANNTVRKHCGAIQAIMDLCGPPSREHREALGLLDVVPYLSRPPQEEKPAEDCYTLAELVRLIEHADLARKPTRIGARPISPGAYHRAIYALVFNTGLRIGGVMGALWNHYHPDHPSGPHLFLPPGSAAKGRRMKRIELNATAVAVIESLRGYDAERIFPWPNSWPASRHSLYDDGHRLIAQCLAPERRELAFHAIRKLHTNELAAINGLACMKSLGHASGRTTVEHYTSRKVVADAVARLPRLRIDQDRQLLLFE